MRWWEVIKGFIAKELEDPALYLKLAHGNLWRTLFTGTKNVCVLPPLFFKSNSHLALNVAQGPTGTMEGKNWDKVYSTEKWKPGILQKSIFTGMRSHVGLEVGRGFTLGSIDQVPNSTHQPPLLGSPGKGSPVWSLGAQSAPLLSDVGVETASLLHACEIWHAPWVCTRGEDTRGFWRNLAMSTFSPIVGIFQGFPGINLPRKC